MATKSLFFKDSADRIQAMLFAIDHTPDSSPAALGLSIAVREMTRAWLLHTRQESPIAYVETPSGRQAFIDLVQNVRPEKAAQCALIDPFVNPEGLRGINGLFTPDPDMARAAWRRAAMGCDHILCGLVHSMSGQAVAQAMANLLLAPTQEGDALICPSRAIRNAVLALWETQTAYLDERFGAAHACRIETPIISLGVDAGKFAALAAPALRAAQRAALNIAEDEVVILFHGRLNFATKAHPLPLLLSAAKAARLSGKKLRVVFYGYFLPREEMEGRFRSLIADFAGAVRCSIVLNDDPRFPHAFWAGADIFASLVDNVQESFGLAPIEAMACGLPAVVTDWDGYRDGVRDGQDGFLIPTLMPPVDAGAAIALAYFNARHYGAYLMGAAQSTAIDTDAAARAFALLANGEGLRRRMGESGRERVRAAYDWSVIIPAYEALWSDLAMRRKAAASPAPLPAHWGAVALDFPNPFAVFGGFASRALASEDILIPAMGEQDVALILRHDMNLFAPDLILPAPLLRTLIEAVRAHPAGITIGELLTVAPPLERQRMWRAIGWLLKHGIATRADQRGTSL